MHSWKMMSISVIRACSTFISLICFTQPNFLHPEPFRMEELIIHRLMSRWCSPSPSVPVFSYQAQNDGLIKYIAVTPSSLFDTSWLRGTAESIQAQNETISKMYYLICACSSTRNFPSCPGGPMDIVVGYLEPQRRITENIVEVSRLIYRRFKTLQSKISQSILADSYESMSLSTWEYRHIHFRSKCSQGLSSWLHHQSYLMVLISIMPICTPY